MAGARVKRAYSAAKAGRTTFIAGHSAVEWRITGGSELATEERVSSADHPIPDASMLMNFDIAEVIRQKQQKQPKSVVIGHGKRIILPGEPEEEIDPSEGVPQDD